MVAGAALLVVMVLELPTFVILAVGMLPTLVAAIVDRTAGKSAALCVGGLNFSGVAPFLVMLWQRGGSPQQAFAIVSDVYAWLVMYSAAAMGWLLFLGLPPVVGAFLKIHAQHRIGALKAGQAQLKAEWGDAVTGRADSPGDTDSP